MELTLFVNHACNLRCSYCYTGEKHSRRMPFDIARRAIDLALERDAADLTLSFFGGEPLLGFELMQAATSYAKDRLSKLNSNAALAVHLNTNATLVDDAVQSFVGVHLPMVAFVSLDGPRAVHDRHRLDAGGRGSYEKARQGIERLVQAGAEVVALAVVNPDTAGTLGEIAAELLLLPAVRVGVVCNLRATWDDAAIGALRGGLACASKHWADAFRAGNAIYFEPFTTKILSHLHGAMPCASRCQLALREIVIAPSGRIYPCGELVGEDRDDRHVIGHVDTGLDDAKIRSLRDAKNRVESTCEGCPIRERCASGCGCKHVALTGSLGSITSVLCDTEAAFVEAADQVAEALYREQCDAFLRMFYRQRWAASAPATFVQLRRREG